jgi:hypothetical protein
MGRIAECVKDVRRIANQSEDLEEAKNRIEQLFSQSRAQHRGHRAVAQRVRDQLNQAYNDTPIDAQAYIEKVLDWLALLWQILFKLHVRTYPFVAVRASLSRHSSDERDDGVTDGRQAWLRRRSVDSFFPISLF